MPETDLVPRGKDLYRLFLSLFLYFYNADLLLPNLGKKTEKGTHFPFSELVVRLKYRTRCYIQIPSLDPFKWMFPEMNTPIVE